MKYIYPALFTPNGNGYTVEFPDLDNCVTEGQDTADAMDMAQDALCMWLDVALEHRLPIPQATSPSDIDAGEGFVSLVVADLDAYRRERDSRPVRRTVSIPGWLDHAADRAGLSLSKVLQDALKERLRV